MVVLWMYANMHRLFSKLLFLFIKCITESANYILSHSFHVCIGWIIVLLITGWKAVSLSCIFYFLRDIKTKIWNKYLFLIFFFVLSSCFSIFCVFISSPQLLNGEHDSFPEKHNSRKKTTSSEAFTLVCIISTCNFSSISDCRSYLK